VLRYNAIGGTVALLETDLLEPSQYRQGTMPKPSPSEMQMASKHGVHVLPVVVVRTKTGGGYEILSGLRTWLVAQQLSVPDVPATVVEHISETDAAEWVRRDVAGEEGDVIAEANCLAQLERELGSKAAAGRMRGIDRSVATRRIKLLELPAEIQRMLSLGMLQENHGVLLCDVTTPERMLLLAKRVTEEGMSVRALRRLVKGVAESSPAAKANSNEKDPVVKHLENEMTEIVGSPVCINYNPNGQGELRIAFANFEVLDGILERLGRKAEAEF
jgi:ParB family chromosome partitioning protein